MKRYSIDEEEIAGYIEKLDELKDYIRFDNLNDLEFEILNDFKKNLRNALYRANFIVKEQNNL